jgi:cytochrome b561
MRFRSSPQVYGLVAIAIHWVTALAVLGLLTSGLIIAGETDDIAKTSLLRMHAVTGSTVLLLTILRILWWWLVDVRPLPTSRTPPLQARAAHAVHMLFYVALIVMGASGIAMIVLSGAGAILTGAAPGPLPDFTAYAPRGAHGIVAFLLMALIAAHVLAALYHQFVLKDRLLARMGLGSAGAIRAE